jgi:electron transfer flavoprotein beta subunit
MNPADRNALEFALQIKEKAAQWNTMGGKVEITTLMLASSENEGILKETLALEADRAVILSDPAFLAGDATAAASALGQAASKLKADLILCGEGALGHLIAEEMKIPSVHSVVKISFDESGMKLLSKTKDGEEKVAVSPPLLASIVAGSNTPRIANAIKIMKAAKKEIIRWTPTDLDLPPDKVGSAASGMVRLRSFIPDSNG